MPKKTKVSKDIALKIINTIESVIWETEKEVLKYKYQRESIFNMLKEDLQGDEQDYYYTTNLKGDEFRRKSLELQYNLRHGTLTGLIKEFEQLYDNNVFAMREKYSSAYGYGPMNVNLFRGYTFGLPAYIATFAVPFAAVALYSLPATLPVILTYAALGLIGGSAVGILLNSFANNRVAKSEEFLSMRNYEKALDKMLNVYETKLTAKTSK